MDVNVRNLKQKIKLWEIQFCEKYLRKPNKADIKGSEVENLYLEYWQAKSTTDKSTTDELPTKKKDDNVWGQKFNKSSLSSKCKANAGTPNVHSSFTSKLWRSSLETSKMCTGSSCEKIKAPVYSSQDLIKNKKDGNDISSSVDPPKAVPQNDWMPLLPSAKFSIKTCNKGNNIFASKLKNTEVDVKWLDKCMSASYEEDEDSNNHRMSVDHYNLPTNGNYVQECTESPSRLSVLTSKTNTNSDLKTDEESVLVIKDSVVQNGSDSVLANSIKPEFEKSTSAGSGQDGKLNINDKNLSSFPETFSTKETVLPETNCDISETLKCPRRKRKALSKENSSSSAENDNLESKPKRQKSEASSNRLVSENFVKINIQRKKFTRGPHRLKSRQLKQMAWKKKKWASSKGKCFSCGQAGHWATNCPKKNETLLNEEALNEIKKLDCDSGNTESVESTPATEYSVERQPIPIFDTEHIESNVLHYLKKFKHKTFRPFQKEAIYRILSGRSTLLVLPTGSGKSLCYQIPACIYAESSKCISLVISPLVSLMEDQIKNHPAFMSSVCLHSGLNQAQRQHCLDRLKSGEAKVLLVAPESLLAMHTYFRTALPPVAFACIDEAHCLSEWSHNFRPSYLQVLKILKLSLNVTCVLGLSATVTEGTKNRICCLLDIDPEEAVFGETFIPDNLFLSVSSEENKEQAVLELLNSALFQNLTSIIVYCTRRETTERLATKIRINSQNDSWNSDNLSNKEAMKSIEAVAAYHAGLSAAQRKATQNKFMKGKLRIVIATVAFGMGLNKADVRAVIHYDLPKSFESYVQEIGRAGRDGQPAYCHLFLQPQADDLWELRRHIYANGVDRSSIRKLLNRIFLPQVKLQESNSMTKDVAISVEEVVQDLDVNKEIIETLLCYLELHPRKWFEVQPVLNNTCTIRCYGGSQQLEKLVTKCKAVDVALQLGSTVKTTSDITFNLVEVCSAMDWDCELVRKELRNEQFASINGSWRRTGVTVEFGNPSFHLRLFQELDSEQKDQLLNFIHDISTQLEKKELRKLDSLFKAFRRFSKPNYIPSQDDFDADVSNGLKNVLCDYFRDSHFSSQEDMPTQSFSKQELTKEIKCFLDIYHEERFNAWQIARIFYGIGSPQFPAEVWGKVRRFWRSFIYVDFPDILSIARQEVIRMRS